MANDAVLPELKEILGAMIFGSNRALSVDEMRRCLVEVAKKIGGETTAFGGVKDGDVRQALEYLRADLEKQKCGFGLAEVAGGFRFQSSASCGRWLRHLLNTDRPNRLSQPGLETLAIIAYRQPVSKSEIEGVRGVNVDHIIKSLLEMQLIRIVGRSELPGRPFLFGTTQTFLEHFGLKSINDLKQMEPMLLRERERKRIEQKLTDSEGEKSENKDLKAESSAENAETKEGNAVVRPEIPTAETEGTEDKVDEEESMKKDEFDEDEEFEDDEDEFDEEDDDLDEDEDGDEDEEEDT
jgi:segregation and condensation protein B